MIVHPLDDLAAYAIEALDAPEREKVARHLARCASCRAAVSAYRDTAWELAGSVDAPGPSAGLRRSIVTRERGLRNVAWERRVIAWLQRPVPLAAPIALAAALVVALVALDGALTEADAYARALSSVAGSKVVSLARICDPVGCGLTAPRGSLVVTPSGIASLVLDVPAVPRDRAWQAWVIRPNAAPLPAGLVAGSGVVLLTLDLAPAPGDTVAVTLEPRSGSRQPTTQPVLTGKVL